MRSLKDHKRQRKSQPPRSAALHRTGAGTDTLPRERLEAPLAKAEVFGQRFHYRQLDLRAAPDVHSQPPPDAASMAVSLLMENGPFRPALSHLYDTDFANDYQEVVVVEGLEPSPAFLADESYRWAALQALCARTLNRAGFVAIRPAAGMCQSAGAETPIPVSAHQGEAFILCQLFGSANCAQLCDPVMDRPIPLFVQPWRAEQGLLLPVRLPETAFSRTLCVQSLGDGRMVLFQKTCPTR